jgi:hypothetical protein
MNDVLIIGNSCDILNKKFGDKIDSFETVVRVGKYNIVGYEDYVGHNTDIVSTIYYNIRDIDKDKNLILVNHYNLDDTTIRIPTEKLDLTNVLHVHSRNDDVEITNFFNQTLNCQIKIPNCNFSLGFRTIFLILKLFPDKNICIHGFDFFKSGYYFKPDHNRNVATRHPYIYERICVKKLIISNKIHELS